MKGMIVNVLLGVGLFAGSIVGALAATGRLNHEGTANIPVLNSLFPPPADTGQAGKGDGAGAPGPGTPAAPAGEVEDASAKGTGAGAEDASHAAGDAPGAEDAVGGNGQDPERPRPLRKGQSLTPSEEKTGGAGGEHGGGTGTEEHAAEPAAGAKDHGKDQGKAEGAAGHGRDEGKQGKGTHPAEDDFARLAAQLADDRKNRYQPGGYFKFEGMPAGVTPDQINEAWQKVRGLLDDLDKRKTALDLREQELRDLADDVARRQTELGKERTEVENLQKALDERIEKFKEQVKLVRTDEVAGLKRNAQSFASFEPSKAAELVREMWRSDKGQDEVLKTFEFMEKDAVNLILAELSKEMIGEVLQKRLKVSKETVPPAGGRQ